MTTPMHFWLFLYSARNLTGSALALGGLGLFFAGVIEHWWLAIVAGLYGTGWLAVPALVQVGQKLVRVEAMACLTRIREVVSALAPRLSDGSMGMEQAVALTNAVTRDLPETVRNYRRLPVAFASLHAVENGKTCKQLLIEQLNLLNDQLRKIGDNVYRDDADALLANGRFLREKFKALSSS